MFRKLHPEHLLMFLDSLDSAAFALRSGWMGYHGHAVRTFLLLLFVLLGSGISPAFRALMIAIVATFMFAELVHRACGRPPLTGFSHLLKSHSG
jgi:hypothetical protein